MRLEPEEPRRQPHAGHLLIRWLVPGLYAFCAVCFSLELGESYRRIWFAEEIASALREASPTNLKALKGLLGDHMVNLTPIAGPSDRPEQNGVSIELSPRLWLHLWVQLAPETDRIADMDLIYANSEDVPLDEPRKGLPHPGWYGWVLSLAVTVLPSWLWVWVTRKHRLENSLQAAAAFVAASPLVVLLPMAGIALLRVSF